MMKRVFFATCVYAGLVMFGAACTSLPERELTADQRIDSAVYGRLASDPLTQTGSYQVQSREGVVTIYGKVSGPQAHAYALAVARGTPGVVRVVDYLSE